MAFGPVPSGRGSADTHTTLSRRPPPAAGLYALKPWYAARLRGLRHALARRGTHPDVVSVSGICFAALAGGGLAVLPQGWAVLVVAPMLALRLAAANLDGALARDTGMQTRRGALLNEIGDRLADLAVLAGCLLLAPAWLVVAVMLAASAPSWVSLAGAAAGAERINGGPVGKTERCLLITVLAAVPESTTMVLVIVGTGSLVTACYRAHQLCR
ncbi:MAG: CDP-alcohol phosphatidyltransferase family protein [Jiangellaceae bacterium]